MAPGFHPARKAPCDDIGAVCQAKGVTIDEDRADLPVVNHQLEDALLVDELLGVADRHQHRHVRGLEAVQVAGFREHVAGGLRVGASRVLERLEDRSLVNPDGFLADH